MDGFLQVRFNSKERLSGTMPHGPLGNHEYYLEYLSSAEVEAMKGMTRGIWKQN